MRQNWGPGPCWEAIGIRTVKTSTEAGRWWLTPVILATQERDQEDCGSKPAGANSFVRPYLEKPFTKIGLVEWLKVKALSSSPILQKKNHHGVNEVPGEGRLPFVDLPLGDK
jgi:hypothetical protein